MTITLEAKGSVSMNRPAVIMLAREVAPITQRSIKRALQSPLLWSSEANERYKCIYVCEAQEFGMTAIRLTFVIMYVGFVSNNEFNSSADAAT